MSTNRYKDRPILRYALILVGVPLFLIAYHQGYLTSSLGTLLATLAAVLVLWFAAAWWRLSASLSNLNTFARLLHTDITRPWWGLPFCFLVKGRWQDRNVQVKFLISILEAFLSRNVRMSIEPKAWVTKDGEGLLTTELTRVSGERIYYEAPERHPLGWTQFTRRSFSEEEVRSILDELTCAAEAVETGKGLEFDCPACSTVIRKEDDKCSKCGWTWKSPV